MKKKLPIGISSFEKIRSEGYYYVDKTPFVAKLLESGTYFLLSRPRRFGKSLFLDTIKQAFLGKKELFQGLYLYNNWDWTQTHPVIHIDFGEGTVEDHEHLKKILLSVLLKHAETYDLALSEELLERKFIELIRGLSKKTGKRVVVLIDEYDKPILDSIEDRERADKIRKVLKNFYSVLKPLDAQLKLVFITGVSKFSKVSLFSGLNQLQDITLHPEFATICGYTQAELENVFSEELKNADIETIKCWYNGYSFCGEPVYNPFDVLLFLSEGHFRPFWFETGTPEFLIKLLFSKKFFLPKMENLKASERLIGSFDVDFIEPENLLFQTGYLTIKKCEQTQRGMIYHLSYPNKEVKLALNEYLYCYFTQTRGEEVEDQREGIEIAFFEANFEKMEKILKSLFAGIPYEWYRKNKLSYYEGYFASVIYSFLVGSGLEVIPEDFSSKGRVDLAIKVRDRLYLLEFKVVESEGKDPKALEVLKLKGYAEKYASQAKEIYLVGIDFSKKKRNIVTFAWERWQ